MPISPVWTPQRSSSQERRAQSAPHKGTPTSRTAPRVGSVCLSEHAHNPSPNTERILKIDYFNQRRVLAEKQKPLLAQAAVQASETRRS
jgi:hypothetical protein